MWHRNGSRTSPRDCGCPSSGRAREGALACADAVETFIARFGVPTKLSALGVARERLHDIAPAVLEELEGFDALDRKITLAEIQALLGSAYQ